MKIFNIYNIDEDTLEKFTSFSNDYWQEPWMIYINTTGGASLVYEQILFILNKKNTLTNNVILNVAQAYSNGFNLVYYFNGEVNILPGARSMIHLSSYDTRVTINNKLANDFNSNWDKVIIQENKLTMDRDKKLFNSILTDKEFVDFTKGYDIHLTETTFKKILKNKI